jgi:hypothetical protein
MFAVDDIDETVERLGRLGARVFGDVVQYKDTYRRCYIRGPEGILIRLAQELGRGRSLRGGGLFDPVHASGGSSRDRACCFIWPALTHTPRRRNGRRACATAR